MNKKVFVVGLGKNTTRKIGYFYEKGNIINTSTDLVDPYTINGDTDWPTVKAEIEARYADNNNNHVDLFINAKTANLFPFIDNIKADYPDALILYVFDKAKWDAKKVIPKYIDIMPNIVSFVDEMHDYAVQHNLVGKTYNNRTITYIDHNGDPVENTNDLSRVNKPVNYFIA